MLSFLNICSDKLFLMMILKTGLKGAILLIVRLFHLRINIVGYQQTISNRKKIKEREEKIVMRCKWFPFKLFLPFSAWQFIVNKDLVVNLTKSSILRSTLNHPFNYHWQKNCIDCWKRTINAYHSANLSAAQ